MPVSLLSLTGVGGAGQFVDPAIPSGPLARWRNSAGTSTTTNGTTLSSWTDTIGSVVASQGGTTALMPTYYTAQIATAQVGYDMALNFDADDYLTHTALTSSNAYTLIVTLRYNGGGIISSGGSNYLLYDNGTAFRTYTGAGSSPSLAHGMTANHWYTIGVRLGGGNADWSINTTATASLGGSSAGSGTYAPTTIGSLPGGGTYFTGEIAEMLFYARQLNTTDFAQAMTAHRQLVGTF